MWEPYGSKELVLESTKHGLLLADTTSGRLRVCQKMRRLSTTCTCLAPAVRTLTCVDTVLAVHEMGNGHRWEDATGTWTEGLHVGNDGLLLKVDRGRSISTGDIKGGDLVHQEEHIVQVWSSIRNHL